MRKWFRNILCLFCCILIISTSYADNDAKKTEDLDWLFVITARDGKINQNQSGQYMLTLEHAKVERVLAFTDRPNRLVEIVSPEAFQQAWKKGVNSFQKDPPNAVVVFGQEKLAMKLISITVDDDKFIFVVTSDDDKMKIVKMGSPSLFVDGLTVHTKVGTITTQKGKLCFSGHIIKTSRSFSRCGPLLRRGHWSLH